MTTKGIDVALFDWSGTLANDLDVVWRTNDATLMSFGIPHQDLPTFKDRFILPWQSFYALYGLGTQDKLDEVDRRFWKLYRTLSREIRPFSGTLPLLRTLKDRGIKTAIVTQTKRGPVMEQLERFGLSLYVDAVVGAEDADELKPSPKPVLAALHRLQADPGRAVFTGDMVEDVLSGNRAGVRVISIVQDGGYQAEDRVRAGGPFAVAHSLAEVGEMIARL